jgi:hypothetical protein
VILERGRKRYATAAMSPSTTSSRSVTPRG